MATRTILITGAGGWLGSKIAGEIASLPSNSGSKFNFILADINEPKMPPNLPPSVQVQTHKTDLTKSSDLAKLFETSFGRPDVVYALHGIMSLGSEENWDLGMAVNFDSVRALLEQCRHAKGSGEPIRFVFTSSTATYGQPLPDVVLPTPACFPSGAYGIAKLLGEYLVTEYTRKGFVCGISVKLPTIVVRPGPPSRATSAFVSGIIREPLHGKQAVCPIGTSVDDPVLAQTKLWVASGGVTLRNIARAMHFEEAKMLKHWRSVELPGFTVTVKEEIDALRKVAGDE